MGSKGGRSLRKNWFGLEGCEAGIPVEGTAWAEETWKVRWEDMSTGRCSDFESEMDWLGFRRDVESTRVAVGETLRPLD